MYVERCGVKRKPAGSGAGRLLLQPPTEGLLELVEILILVVQNLEALEGEELVDLVDAA